MISSPPPQLHCSTTVVVTGWTWHKYCKIYLHFRQLINFTQKQLSKYPEQHRHYTLLTIFCYKSNIADLEATVVLGTGGYQDTWIAGEHFGWCRFPFPTEHNKGDFPICHNQVSVGKRIKWVEHFLGKFLDKWKFQVSPLLPDPFRDEFDKCWWFSDNIITSVRLGKNYPLPNITLDLIVK